MYNDLLNFDAVFIDSLNSYLKNISCAQPKNLNLNILKYLQKFTNKR